MIQSINQQQDYNTLQTRLISLYEYFIENKDKVNAEKVWELGKKLENREFAIAFCGHFSAGKSTMINTVIGEKLLPSSPIPTSANLVKVKSGDEYAKVIFKKEKPRLYLAPYDYEMVKNFCKDGDMIEEIEISHKTSSLPENAVILDTPGIDSADDAHRVATESAIHLADLVFYVMDYNHVQSELNFMFTKELAQAGKETYLVINQIDKHREEELSFEEFRNSVEESFASWGVKPAGIFYTSLKDNDHPLNQFTALKHFILSRLKLKDELLVPSLFSSMKKLTVDHLREKQLEKEDYLAPYRELLTELSAEEQRKIPENLFRFKEELQALDDKKDKAIDSFENESEKIIKNAYLMPFQTRELAESYLESCQPEFKVGFLFSRQKTQDEREARLDHFYNDLFEKTKSQLKWHLREYLISVTKEYRLEEQKLTAMAQSFSIQFSKELLESTVKKGARLSGDYVLNYTDDVVKEINKLARGQLTNFKEAFSDSIKLKNDSGKKKLESELSEISRLANALKEIKGKEEEIGNSESSIYTILTEDISNKALVQAHFFSDEEEVEIIRNSLHKEEKQKIVSNGASDNNPLPVNKSGAESEESRVPIYANRLRSASALVEGISGFSKLANGLREKAGRLENRSFTVALFGAFSAGKSSFANALIGEKVLPVSPNPTTAAINKIKPVTSSIPHGTVLVKVKDSKTLLEDVNKSLEVFGLSAVSFHEAQSRIIEVLKNEKQDNALEKTHFSFLKAFRDGFSSFESLFGKIIEKNLDDFSDYVAKEEKSCFVEWIELYYDCELTRKGITLVDTPGADSINARHTGVAFEYIRNSDAILFVTYYNHAFSRADREFLIQLGRVKESFQLDKMFFIINAADLAESEEEKNSVVQYVGEQLVQYGIKRPHLYPLSSLLALEEKKTETPELISGMPAFENNFYHFINHDLTDIAISSARNELDRLKERIQNLIQAALEDQTDREKKRAEIEAKQDQALAWIEKQTPEYLLKSMTQESDELTYYIKQRVFLRFSDFFKESFNPATLKDDGRNLKKEIQNCLEDLLKSIGFDFAQEMRATLLRLENYSTKLLKEFNSSMQEKFADIDQGLSLAEPDLSLGVEMDFPNAFENMNRQVFAKALSYFKNPKSFFEKNDKKLTGEEIYNVLQIPADEYLSKENGRMKDSFENSLDNEFINLQNQMKEQAEEYFLSILSALGGDVPLDKLEGILRQLEE